MPQDLRYAFRTLRKSPGFTTIAVLCLALGIGANTAIFSLLDAALLRMLPVPQPERLVLVRNFNERGAEGMGGSRFSNPQFAYLQSHVKSAEAFAYARISLNLSAGDVTDSPTGQLVSSNYFSALGVQPAIGRGLRADDESVAVISHRYWQSRFHADPTTPGRTIVLNGLPFTVIGVMTPRFFGVEVGSSPDVYVPLTMCDRLSPGTPRLPLPNSFWLSIMARLHPQSTAAQATAEMNAAYHQGHSEAGLRPNLARMLQQRRISVAPGGQGPSTLRAQFGAPLLILMTLVGLVLLIACANVANLLLARAAAREKEIAIRHALGATRAHLLRQFLTESLVLAIAGGTLGLLFAFWSAQSLAGFLPRSFLEIAPDVRVLGFTLAISLLTGLLFGATPAVRAARANLKVHSRSLGRYLVSAQVAISVVLLAGAGLFLRTLVNLRGMDNSFHADQVLLASVNPGLNRYSAERTRSFYAELLERASSLPTVQSASIADAPLLGGTFIDGLSVEGNPIESGAHIRLVGPRFFETMGIALRSGRDFTALESAKVAIINETIARTYFAGQNPLGKHVGSGDKMEIVGVVADAKYRGLRETVPNTLYIPLEQSRYAGPERTLHVRTAGSPAGMAPALREVVRALDKDLPVKISLFSDLVDDNLVQERLVATLSGFFGALALLLAAIGLYGVMAYRVERRTREIGIRMSLGAERSAVLWMVLRDCLLMAAIGLALGVPASIWLGRLVTRQLFGVAPGDPVAIIGAAALLAVVAALAGFLPARRASRVDPMVALRYD